jgi:molybdate transport system substrate-binding protein
MMFRAFSTVFAACLLVLSVNSPTRAKEESLNVIAAVSLKEVLEEAGKTFTASGGPEVKFSFVSSGHAAKQLEAGAPYDVYASADVKWMGYAAEKKLIRPNTRSDIFGNSLVIIALETSNLKEIPLTSEAIARAMGDGKFTMSDTDNTASGNYGKSAFRKLGLWDTIEPRLLMARNDLAATIYVARGDAQLGLVYYTESKIERSVKVVATLPEDSHEPVIYSFAATAFSKGDTAKLFTEYLKTPSATAIFEKAGFTVLSK